MESEQLNDEWINNETKAEIKMFFKTIENEVQCTRVSQTHLKACLGEIYSNKYLHEKKERPKIDTLSSKLKEQDQKTQKLAEDKK